MKQLPNTAVTHGGKFHADDVFSAALLKLLKPDISIIRTLSPESDGEDKIFFDIGFGEFDHHQKNAPVRENGIPYAAFGLLWRTFGQQIVGERAAVSFENSFVAPLDLEDNTGKFHPVAELIAAFNPVFDSDADVNLCFEEAVIFAKGILEREFLRIAADERAAAAVLSAIDKAENGIAVLDTYCPWKKAVEGTNLLFVVYPSNRGGFAAQTVPVSKEDNTPKCPFPEYWAGQPQEKLREITGIETLNFCHNNRFLITAETKEDCIKACKLLIDRR